MFAALWQGAPTSVVDLRSAIGFAVMGVLRDLQEIHEAPLRLLFLK